MLVLFVALTACSSAGQKTENRATQPNNFDNNPVISTTADDGSDQIEEAEFESTPEIDTEPDQDAEQTELSDTELCEPLDDFNGDGLLNNEDCWLPSMNIMSAAEVHEFNDLNPDTAIDLTQNSVSIVALQRKPDEFTGNKFYCALFRLPMNDHNGLKVDVQLKIATETDDVFSDFSWTFRPELRDLFLTSTGDTFMGREPGLRFQTKTTNYSQSLTFDLGDVNAHRRTIAGNSSNPTDFAIWNYGKPECDNFSYSEVELTNHVFAEENLLLIGVRQERIARITFLNQP